MKCTFAKKYKNAEIKHLNFFRAGLDNTIHVEDKAVDEYRRKAGLSLPTGAVGSAEGKQTHS